MDKSARRRRDVVGYGGLGGGRLRGVPVARRSQVAAGRWLGISGQVRFGASFACYAVYF